MRRPPPRWARWPIPCVTLSKGAEGVHAAVTSQLFLTKSSIDGSSGFRLHNVSMSRGYSG
jgi:hypothetical protein